MLKFQWNALRRGDPVFVHDAADTDFVLLYGEVTIVDTVVGGTNDLAVRVPTPTSHVIRPARLTVHLDPLDPNEDCWRCVIADPRRSGRLPSAEALAA